MIILESKTFLKLRPNVEKIYKLKNIINGTKKIQGFLYRFLSSLVNQMLLSEAPGQISFFQIPNLDKPEKTNCSASAEVALALAEKSKFK